MRLSCGRNWLRLTPAFSFCLPRICDIIVGKIAVQQRNGIAPPLVGSLGSLRRLATLTAEEDGGLP